jgi:Na+/citrate or Na+/malate symporter
MGGDADEGILSQHPACLRNAAVILPEVDTIRPKFSGQGQIVIDDKGDATARTEKLQLASFGKTGSVVLHLVAILETGHTTGKCPFHPLEKVVMMVGYEIEAFWHLQLLVPHATAPGSFL